jgi:4-hydroxy-tetrahydrodipicolinate synthase
MDITRRAALGATLASLLNAATPARESGKARSKTPRVPEGLWPVMLTPFNEDKSVDWIGLDALTDWYLANGADGLFSCCQSSEVWQLTEGERLEVTARVVKRAGKIPVVAGGLPGFTPGTVTPFVAKLADAGVRAAVLTTCQIAEKTDSDAVWQERVEAILEATDRLPFGLYEAPSPYKRLLTGETIGWAARTGRFVFDKDTSCDIAAIETKLKAIHGTPLRLFNAHVPILIAAIRKGGNGFSGIAANAYPNVVAYAVHHESDDPKKAEAAQDFLTKSEPTLGIRYPASAKVMAAMAGVPIKPECRKKVASLNAEQMENLRALRKAADALLS